VCILCWQSFSTYCCCRSLLTVSVVLSFSRIGAAKCGHFTISALVMSSCTVGRHRYLRSHYRLSVADLHIPLQVRMMVVFSHEASWGTDEEQLLNRWNQGKQHQVSYCTTPTHPQSISSYARRRRTAISSMGQPSTTGSQVFEEAVGMRQSSAQQPVHSKRCFALCTSPRSLKVTRQCHLAAPGAIRMCVYVLLLVCIHVAAHGCPLHHPTDWPLVPLFTTAPQHHCHTHTYNTLPVDVPWGPPEVVHTGTRRTQRGGGRVVLITSRSPDWHAMVSSPLWSWASPID
jgi:hypothetical protein